MTDEDVQVFRVVDNHGNQQYRTAGQAALYLTAKGAKLGRVHFDRSTTYCAPHRIQVLRGAEETVMPVPLYWEDVPE